MTRDEKMLFSWRVFLCYYEDTRRSIPKCDSSNIRECTSQLSPNDFDIFTQFFNHGDSMCYYRESREWQERVDQSVRRLEDATEQTVSLLQGNMETAQRIGNPPS